MLDKYFLLSFFYLIILNELHAQIRYISPFKDLEEKSLRLEFQLGYNLLGTVPGVKDGMTNSSLNHVFVHFFGESSFPKAGIRPEIRLGARYYLNHRNGIRANIGLTDWSRVRGYNKADREVLAIESQIRSITFNYIERLKDYKNEFMVGLLLYNYHVYALQENIDYDWETFRKENFYGVGLNLAFVHKIKTFDNGFDIAFKSDLSFMPSHEIGPFIREDAMPFIPAKVNLTSLTVGFILGWKPDINKTN